VPPRELAGRRRVAAPQQPVALQQWAGARQSEERRERAVWLFPRARSKPGAALLQLAAVSRPAAQSQPADLLPVAAQPAAARSRPGALLPRAELREPLPRAARPARPARPRQAPAAAPVASPGRRQGATPVLPCWRFSCSRFAFGRSARPSRGRCKLACRVSRPAHAGRKQGRAAEAADGAAGVFQGHAAGRTGHLSRAELLIFVTPSV
jgi:hypothetical protein